MTAIGGGVNGGDDWWRGMTTTAGGGGHSGMAAGARVVLDTNVLLSALVFHGGRMTWWRAAWQSGVIRPLMSRATTDELLRVLRYPKFQLAAHEREDLLADYLPWCEAVTVGAAPPVPACRDELDIPFLELALVGRAAALISGDRDLLALAADFAVPVVTPAAARARIIAGEGFGDGAGGVVGSAAVDN